MKTLFYILVICGLSLNLFAQDTSNQAWIHGLKKQAELTIREQLPDIAITNLVFSEFGNTAGNGLDVDALTLTFLVKDSLEQTTNQNGRTVIAGDGVYVRLATIAGKTNSATIAPYVLPLAKRDEIFPASSQSTVHVSNLSRILAYIYPAASYGFILCWLYLSIILYIQFRHRFLALNLAGSLLNVLLTLAGFFAASSLAFHITIAPVVRTTALVLQLAACVMAIRYLQDRLATKHSKNQETAKES